MSALVVPPLNAGQSRILRTITEGGKIESERTYPYPRHFWLFRKNGYKYAARVPEGTVATLIELRLIHPVQLDATGDRIVYYTTTLGVRAVQKQSALPDPDTTQLDLLGDDAPEDARQSA